MKNTETKELINRVKVMRNLIVANMQLVPTVENRFNQKKMIDNAISLAKTLNNVQDELVKRGIYTYE